MVSYSAKLDSRAKQHTQFGVSASNGSRDMARTKVAEKKKKNEHGQNYIASPTGIANNNNTNNNNNNNKSVTLAKNKDPSPDEPMVSNYFNLHASSLQKWKIKEGDEYKK